MEFVHLNTVLTVWSKSRSEYLFRNPVHSAPPRQFQVLITAIKILIKFNLIQSKSEHTTALVYQIILGSYTFLIYIIVVVT